MKESYCGEWLAWVDSRVGVPDSGFTEVNRGRSPVGVLKVSMRDLRKQTAG